ncbi:MAG: hypothetical protein NXH85_04605 [Pseudomonadaceae bacterium]|nr:hypothetical protein [Pseudomonadaceae bacterium]
MIQGIGGYGSADSGCVPVAAMLTVNISILIIAVASLDVILGVKVSELMSFICTMRMAITCTINRAFYARHEDKQEQQGLKDRADHIHDPAGSAT